MDTSSQGVNPKKQRLDGGEEIEGGSKSCGNLPKEVIERIFSMLPTKDAIRTSVLCKNWEHLWLSFSKLSFFQKPSDNREAFLKAVNNALILRDVDVKEFSLSCPVRVVRASDIFLFTSWISGLVRRNVEKLSLKGPFRLPPCLFTCATVRDLELNLPCQLKLPANVCFSSLRRLSLNSVKFIDEHSTQKLISGCPVLNELCLINCNWVKLKSVTITASNLLSLIIYEPGGHVPNCGNCCQITVNGASLKYFRYKGDSINEYYFHNSSIDQVEILPLTLRSIHGHAICRFCKLFQEFSSVKILSTSYSSCKVVQTDWSTDLLVKMPVFSNLVTLIFQEKKVNIGCKGLLKMFQNCPCLQALIFSEGISLSSDEAEDDTVLEPMPPCILKSLKKIEVYAFRGDQNELEPMPPCILKSLKKIEVYAFRGDQNELDAVKILLKYAVVLEKMIITCVNSFIGGLEKLRHVNNQLADLRRGSSSACCEVVCSLSALEFFP